MTIRVADFENILPELFTISQDFEHNLEDYQAEILIMGCERAFLPDSRFTVFIDREPDNHTAWWDFAPQMRARPNHVFAVTCHSATLDWRINHVWFPSNLVITSRTNPDADAVTLGEKSWDALALFGGWMPQREIMARELVQQGLDHRCLINLRARAERYAGRFQDHDKDKAAMPFEYQSPQIPALDHERFTAVAYQEGGIYTMAMYGDSKPHSWISQLIPPRLFDSAYINIVAETINQAQPDTFYLSEKTAKPLLVAQPFLVFGCQHFLKHLRDMGILTYSPWLDESYDDIPDQDQRARAVIRSFARFSRQTTNEKLQAMREMRAIAEYNRALVLDNRCLLTNVVDQIKQHCG